MNNRVIDETAALNWCQQERPLLVRVLASFYQQYRAYIELSQPGAADSQRLAHDLKSVAPSCGATALAEFADRIAPPAGLPTEAEQQQLLAHLRAALLCIESAYPEALALCEEKQQDRLQELRQTLDQHNLKAVTMFKSWAANCAPDWPLEVTQEIQHALDSFDFKQAKLLLDQALSKYGTTR